MIAILVSLHSRTMESDDRLVGMGNSACGAAHNLELRDDLGRCVCKASWRRDVTAGGSYLPLFAELPPTQTLIDKLRSL